MSQGSEHLDLGREMARPVGRKLDTSLSGSTPQMTSDTFIISFSFHFPII